MPELPEVETITRQLIQKIKGLTIQNVDVDNKNSLQGSPKDIIGTKIDNIYRWAKNIVVDLSNKKHLLIHLKMTGQLIYRIGQPARHATQGVAGGFGGGHPVPPFKDMVPNKFTRVSFDFPDGSHLYFNDIRKFGWIKLLTGEELDRVMKNVGPDAMAGYFKLAEFKKRMSKHKNKMIKPVLMDQNVIAGLGNIYAAEVCFRAGILPNRKISALSNKDFDNLFKAIKFVLSLAIKYKGTSADAYVTLEGKKGDYESKLWVYGREGQSCPKKCGGKIEKTMLAGRGTYFCPACQL